MLLNEQRLQAVRVAGTEGAGEGDRSLDVFQRMRGEQVGGPAGLLNGTCPHADDVRAAALC